MLYYYYYNCTYKTSIINSVKQNKLSITTHFINLKPLKCMLIPAHVIENDRGNKRVEFLQRLTRLGNNLLLFLSLVYAQNNAPTMVANP